MERLNEDARIALDAAQAIARTTGAERVRTEHLLIGLLSVEGTGVRVLRALGVEPARLLREVRGRTGDDESAGTAVEGFSARAQKAMNLALVEADDLHDQWVGTDHLLLGLIREGEGVAGRALAQIGVDIENARLAAEAVRAQAVEPERNPEPTAAVKPSRMWQRFTERARKVVFYAQEEAQKFGEGYVSTEHLLLGLVRESDSVAARILEQLGVSLNRVRVEVEKQLPRGDSRPSQDMTLTPRAKRVIDLAYDEARNLNNNYIGTEHLLLGLIREGDGLAGRVLAKLGVELERARRETIALQDQEGGSDSGRSSSYAPGEPRPPAPPPADPWAGFEDAARVAFVAAEAAALGRGQSFRSPEHLLLGLLQDRENAACRALLTLSIDLDHLREAVEARCRTAPAREGEAPLSPAATQAFTLAYKEQAMLGAERTGPEHVLLGLLREPDGVAGRTMEEFGVGLAALREAIRELTKADAEVVDETRAEDKGS